MEDPSWLLSDKTASEFYTSERCYITELLSTDASPQVSLARARVKPGVTTQLHALRGVVESYVIKRGSGIIEIDRLPHPVKAGDRVLIKAGLPQRITNNGKIDLEFYFVCTPRFTPDCYINLESDTQDSSSD